MPLNATPLSLSFVADYLLVLGAIVALVALGVLSTVRSAVFYRAFGSRDGAQPAAKVNCPSCGARTAAERSVCEYCGESLSESAPSDDR